MTTGLLLFAHGARDPNWAQPFEAVARQVRAQHPRLAVRLGFLEFMSPDLQTAAEDLVQAGCRRLQVLPLFLGAGGHVRKDLPQLLQMLQAAHPGLDVQLHPAIGEMPAVIAAMAEAAAGLVSPE